MQLGYLKGAPSLDEQKKSSRVIGVVTSLTAKEIPFRHLAGVQKALRKRGYITALIDSSESMNGVLEDLSAVHAEGCIVMIRDGDYISDLRPEKLSIPMVLVGTEPTPGICTIVIDRTAAEKELTKHLIDLGHRRILFVARTLLGNQCKWAGYQDAMRSAGLSREISCLELPRIFQGGLDVMMENVNLFRSVTAVVSTGDQVAVEVIQGLQSIGISVPQGCSVVGFSDHWASEMSNPPLTTVHVPREELGEMVVPMLQSIMEGKQVQGKRIVPKVIHRGSVAPPPGKRRK